VPNFLGQQYFSGASFVIWPKFQPSGNVVFLLHPPSPTPLACPSPARPGSAVFWGLFLCAEENAKEMWQSVGT